jgi:hypothetical protein
MFELYIAHGNCSVECLADVAVGSIRDRVEPAAGRAMSAVAPFATKNGALPKRQERPARAIACAHGKKVLAYEAE